MELDTRNSRVRETFRVQAARRNAALQEMLKKARVDRLAIQTDEDYQKSFRRFFHMHEEIPMRRDIANWKLEIANCKLWNPSLPRSSVGTQFERKIGPGPRPSRSPSPATPWGAGRRTNFYRPNGPTDRLGHEDIGWPVGPIVNSDTIK